MSYKSGGETTRFLTGIKPTGMPHLGNWVGAIRPSLDLIQGSLDREGFYFIADLHALTAPSHDPVALRTSVLEVAATWLALGLDPSRCVLYVQSQIPQIPQLHWILSCFTPKGLMNRGHAYKSRVEENTTVGRDSDHGISLGLYSYPVLMAADILIAHADVVPVGRDQLQHVEVAREIVQRLHHSLSTSSLLTLPESRVHDGSSVLRGLDGRKMSKSYGNHIPIFSSSSKLRKSIMKIQTDSRSPQEPKEPEGVLFEIYSAFAAPGQIEEISAYYRRGIGWGEVKNMIFELIDGQLVGAREAYSDLMAHPRKIEEILADGSSDVRSIAAKTLREVSEAIGLPL